MRLKQKYFIPFMVVVAAVTLVIIVFSSFNFNEKQAQRFKHSIAYSDSLLIMPLPVIGSDDSLTIGAQQSKYTILVFWSSWSEKSKQMLNELQRLKEETDSLTVIAAIVKDAEESLPANKEYLEFHYVDGVALYNYQKVPGFPSYVMFNEKHEVLHVQVGYQEGVGYDSLKTKMK